MHKLADGVESMVEAVTGAGGDMRAAAQSMSGLAEESSRRSNTVSAAFQQGLRRHSYRRRGS